MRGDVRVTQVRRSPSADGAVVGRIAPDPVTRALSAAPSLFVYLKRLRVLGAWWCRGSSGVGPEQLMLYERSDHVPPRPGVVPIRGPGERQGRPQ